MIKFVIITHVPHLFENSSYYAYGPYVHEMNIWSNYVDELVVVAPMVKAERTKIDNFYTHKKIRFLPIPSFDVLSLKGFFLTFLKFPKLLFVIFKAMKAADHIHLRCPGNIGLLGCLIQILFPNTPKTAKYAGNWDPTSKQPWSYQLQKWILSNTFLTRKMQVLVYGEWPNQSENIKPFFTATYAENEKLPAQSLNLSEKINFIFVGSLVKGKNPLYAIRLVECLLKNKHNISLNIYGDGILKAELEKYIRENYLENSIFLHGNQDQETLKKAYQESHFVILASDSEGWPKAIAEGMFWGCVPLATAVSCVPFMLDHGKRGVLLDVDLKKDVKKTEMLLNDQTDFYAKSVKASEWSGNYTLDVFEKGIKNLLKQDSTHKG